MVHDTYDDVQRSGKYYGGDTAYSFNTESLPYEAETTYDGAEATDPSYNGIEKSIYDPVLNTGCPQCGSLRYNR